MWLRATACFLVVSQLAIKATTAAAAVVDDDTGGCGGSGGGALSNDERLHARCRRSPNVPLSADQQPPAVVTESPELPKMLSLLFWQLMFAIQVHRSYEQNPRMSTDTEQSIIRRLLGNGTYDWRIRPVGTPHPSKDASPVMVTVNMYLRTISKVDDVNMEYSLHFTFREEWIDERLLFSDAKLKYVNLTPGQRIWMPDTFFQNEKDGKKHDIDTPNVLLRVNNGTGKILYSVRLGEMKNWETEIMTLTLSCPMMLHNYPMDIQYCRVEFASYAYTDNDIDYAWRDVNPIQIKLGLKESLPSFTLSRTQTGICSSVTTTGNYSCLSLTLILKREFSYYMLQLYIPSFMLVAVSWVSFWLDKDSVPARVTLGVTTLLTMTTQASGINAKLPPVSYTKAIDVWIGVCLAFIFGALLEFALINYAARRDMLEQSRGRRRNKQHSGGGAGTTFVNMNNPLLQAVQSPTVGYVDMGSHIGYQAIEHSVDHAAAPYKQQQQQQQQHQRMQLANNNQLVSGQLGSGSDPQNQMAVTFSAATQSTTTARLKSPIVLQQQSQQQSPGRLLGNTAAAVAMAGHSKKHRRTLLSRLVPRLQSKNSAKRIDVLARIVFPVTFVLFNFCYWLVYLRPYLEQGFGDEGD